MSTLTDTWLQLALDLARDGFRPRPLEMTDENMPEFGKNLAHDWMRCAFPCMSVGENFAASMTFTKLPADICDVEFPWDTFMFAWPAFITESIRGLGGYSESATFINKASGGFAVTEVKAVWNPWARKHEVRVGFNSGYFSLAQFCEATERASTPKLKALARVMVGALCEMNKKPSGGASVGTPPGPSKRDGLPRVWNFRITRPVQVGLLREAREFVRTGDPGPNLQRLVRGHWQRYHVGPRAQSKTTWIHKEPYWHGNQDAPIALHQHVIGGAK